MSDDHVEVVHLLKSLVIVMKRSLPAFIHIIQHENPNNVLVFTIEMLSDCLFGLQGFSNVTVLPVPVSPATDYVSELTTGAIIEEFLEIIIHYMGISYGIVPVDLNQLHVLPTVLKLYPLMNYMTQNADKEDVKVPLSVYSRLWFGLQRMKVTHEEYVRCQ